MKERLHKFKKWIIRDDLNLSNKWWHRFFKVGFIISIIALTGALVVDTFERYDTIINKWMYVESLSARLRNPVHTSKIFSIQQLYGPDEVITTFDRVYSYDNYSPGLGAKSLLFPLDAMFLLSEDTKFKSFCSDQLDKHVETISRAENIRNFSSTNPTFINLYTDIGVFKDYLRINSYSISCLTTNSYTIPDENGSEKVYAFLEPVETREYSIYKYESGILDLIFVIVLKIIALLAYILIMLLIYYKILLYIVFGSKK